MKQYVAPLYTQQQINELEENEATDYPLLSPVTLENWHWEGRKKYRPKVQAEVFAVEGECLSVGLKCWERWPVTTYTNRDDPVYQDSCLEFFIAAKPGDPRYINIEANSEGVYLLQFGEARENRVFLKDLTDNEIIVEPDFSVAPKIARMLFRMVLLPWWSANIEISLELLKALYGKDYEFYDGMVMRGNFYKCGDKTKIPHWGAWAPVTTNPPGFHNPECFGEIILKKVA